MRKYQIPKSSFLYYFIKRFIMLIILPVLVCWLICTAVLDYFYTDNTLASQQVSMEKSLSFLDTSLTAISNVITALESNSEITYYLDYYSNKPEMLYSLVKNIRSFCSNLYSMNSYLSSIKIYSSSPILLYSSPFEKLENIPLTDVTLESLFNSGVHESVWRVSHVGENLFPTVYCYQKLYAYNYAKCIGYVEVQLAPEIFADYLELLENLVGNSGSDFTLYHENEPLYSTMVEPVSSISYEAKNNEYHINLLRQTYENCIKFPELGFCLIRSGKLSGIRGMSNTILTPVISIVILFLLILFFIFFSSVASLSKRILDFSSFIRHSNPDHLESFQPEQKSQSGSDELDILINAYNSMINENTALISQVQKMELLSQNARYQALQDQIHPHFIYGTLEAIRMTALQNKDRDTASMIFSLSALIRYSISISSQAVTLADEVKIASHYLSIQKMRFDERLNYEFSLDETLMDLALPSFILQPLLENAILYGISQTLDSCRLLVRAYRQNANIFLSVSNSGLPITAERIAEVNDLLSGKLSPEQFHGNRNGMALSNIKERLTIFFHGRASIRMTLENGYTTTIITIQEEGKN